MWSTVLSKDSCWTSGGNTGGVGALRHGEGCVAIHVEVPRSRDELVPPPAHDLLEFDVHDVVDGLIGDIKVKDHTHVERELVLQLRIVFMQLVDHRADEVGPGCEGVVNADPSAFVLVRVAYVLEEVVRKEV